MRATVVIIASLSVLGCKKKAPEPVAAPTPVAAPADAGPAFVSEEVTWTVGSRTIGGTLTRPSAPGRHAAVLIHAGSGATDRDWNNPGLPGKNGAGALLGAALATEGFVVLRFDKLGTGKTTVPEPLTWDAVLDDAAGGVELLRASPHVDGRIFLAGHSEGGPHMIGLARRLKDSIAGLVLLSSPGRSMSDLILAQLDAQFRAALDGTAADAEMKPIRAAMADFFSGTAVDPTAVSKHAGVQQLLAGVVHPASAVFVREFYAFDPAAGLAEVAVPILIYNGAKDIQVSPAVDVPLLEAAAKAAGRDATVFVAANADHVLELETRPLAELGPAAGLGYGAADRDLDPASVAAVVGWLRQKSQ